MALADRVKSAKILTIDIETSPSVVYTWGRFQQNIGLNQVIEDGSVICFAAKWYGNDTVHFYSDHHDGHLAMVQAAHALMHEAEIIVGYNSRAFDVKHLHREFMLAGIAPPSPHKDVDLLTAVRQSAKWESNKLDNIAQRLGLGEKVKHEGFDLWKACMAGDSDAWTRMQTYNIQDVVLTEQLYDEIRPWIKGHPHMGVIGNDETKTCNRCGSEDLRRDGTWLASKIQYALYQCNNCGGWVHSGRHSRAAVSQGI